MHRLCSKPFIAFCAVSTAALIALTPWAARAQVSPAVPAQSSAGASVGAGALTMQSEGAAAQVVYGDVRSPNRLSIVQLCSPTRGRCNLAFVDTREGEDAAALVRDYFRRTGGQATPNVTTQATCAGGWIDRVEADPGRPYEAATHSGGDACDSTLPLVESLSCKAQAAVQLRAAGVP